MVVTVVSKTIGEIVLDKFLFVFLPILFHFDLLDSFWFILID